MIQNSTRVLGGALGAVAFGWLANAVPVAAPTAIVATVVAFVVLVALESPSIRDEHWAKTIREQEWRDLALFSVASVLLGAIVGAVWTLPIGTTRVWEPYFPMLDAYGVTTGSFSNIELGAAIVIVALAIVAALRGATGRHLASFVLASSCGLALWLASISWSTMFGLTWLTWAIVGGFCVAVVRAIPEAARQFAVFFNLGDPAGREGVETSSARSEATRVPQTPREELAGDPET